MKKTLFLFLFIFIKLSAYEYLIATNANGNYIIYRDNNGNMYITRKMDNSITNTLMQNDSNLGLQLNLIQKNLNSSYYNYIGKLQFDEYFKNDLVFLNDLYTNNSFITKMFLNYLYNNSTFDNNHYEDYQNYEILYNDQGLAVESILDDQWNGLYDNKENSGYLFDSNGRLLYKSGKKLDGVNYYINLLNLKIIKAFHSINFNTLKLIPIIILVFSVFYLIIRKFKGSINGIVKYFN